MVVCMCNVHGCIDCVILKDQPQWWLFGWHHLQAPGLFCHVERLQTPEKLHMYLLISSQYIFLSQKHLPDYNQQWTHLWWSPERNPCQLEPQLDKQPILDDRSSFDKPAKWKCFKQKIPLFCFFVFTNHEKTVTCCSLASLLSSARNSSQQTVRRNVYLSEVDWKNER